MKDEITAGTGDLVDWARARPATFWQTDIADVVAAMMELSAWATDPARQYRQEAIDEFLDSADYKLIAHALATGATVVTREQPAPESKKKIKIPDVCNAFAVVWTDLSASTGASESGSSRSRRAPGNSAVIPQENR